jgi:hypothetical protein
MRSSETDILSRDWRIVVVVVGSLKMQFGLVFMNVCCQAIDVAVVMRRRSKSSAYIMALISREFSLPSLHFSLFNPITPVKYSLRSINALVRSRTREPMEAD